MPEETLIRETLALAASAKSKGNHPFGACLVRNDEIILKAENTVVTGKNPTYHAETNLVNKAWESLSSDVIKECTLYTSCEPCPMCTGAIFWSGIRRVVYSLPALALGEIAGDKFCRPCIELFDRADDKTEVVGPILEEEGAALHRGFWNSS